MRRAMPYPCNGPSACRFSSTIKARCLPNVFLSPIVSPWLIRITLLDAPVPVGNAIEETRDPLFVSGFFFFSAPFAVTLPNSTSLIRSDFSLRGRVFNALLARVCMVPLFEVCRPAVCLTVLALLLASQLSLDRKANRSYFCHPAAGRSCRFPGRPSKRHRVSPGIYPPSGKTWAIPPEVAH